MKNWLNESIELLTKSLVPVPNELDNLDWKEDLSPNNTKLAKHLSAFANHPGGGYIVFGINDKTGKIIGIEKDKIDEINNKISNIAINRLEPIVRLDNEVIEYENIPILVIKVSESAVKPTHIRGKSIEESYIRSGGTTRKADRNDLTSLLLNSKTPRWEELHASKLLPKNDVINLLNYKRIFDLLERPAPIDPDEIMNWLEEEKMVKRINGSGYYITNFGAISCANDINTFDDISRKAIRLIKYKGNNKIDAEREQKGVRGYAVGFERLINFLMALLPTSEVIKKAIRTETTLYPEIALRELIVNALIHQDFTITGKCPMIEIFDNRIEISNPGKLLPSKKIDRLIGTSPESRNEMLAGAFRRYNLCEERGSGFIKTVNALELWGLPPLQFEEGENYFKVTMFAPRTFAEMSPNERIEACYQHAVLKFYSGESLTNTSLRNRFKMNEKQRSQISRLITKAIEDNKIKPKDPDNKSAKFVEYVPIWA